RGGAAAGPARRASGPARSRGDRGPDRPDLGHHPVASRHRAPAEARDPAGGRAGGARARGTAHGAHGAPARRQPLVHGGPAAARHRRGPQSGAAGAHQPDCERDGGHAPGRADRDRDLGLSQRRAAGRRGGGERHRLRHSCRCDRARVRAVLHHETPGPGHRPGPFDLPRHRARARRHAGRAEPRGPGHDLHRMAARARGGGMSAPSVLIVDNDPEMLAMLRRHLEVEGLAVAAVTGGREALDAIAAARYDVILTDLIMDDTGGLEVLAAAQARAPPTRVLLMTACGSLETAIEAMRQGAYDYLTKPFKLAEVTHAVRRALDDQRLREENARLRAEGERQVGFERGIGEPRLMRAVLGQVRAVADSDASVLLLGESGTGKELVARALHWSSGRRAGPFVPVNCAAVPEGLLESELFGHEKGAFTGADRKH